MKKILLVAALIALPLTSMAAAPDACTGGTGTAIDAATDGSKFVRIAFTPVCSANSIVQYGQSSTVLWGASGSAKGSNTFVGTTNGGSVKANGSAACGKNGCESGEVGTALSAAATLAGT